MNRTVQAMVRKTHALLIFLILTMITGCTRQEADLLITNAVVYTVDPYFSRAESFVVTGGKITASGTTAEMTRRFNAREVVDMERKVVYPGFIDAHAHFTGYGINLIEYADLKGTRSPKEVYARLLAHIQKTGGPWLLGRGWDQNDWPVKEFPDNEELDRLFPDIPVYLVRIDGHAGWCNSKALKIAGVTAEIRIDGGEVVLKNGKPSGILIDNARTLVTRLIPVPGSDLKIKALHAAQENCLRAGLTSVTDCGLPKSTILLMDSLHKSGILKIRINAMINPDQENFDHFLKNGIYKTDRLQVNTIKIYADGALGSRGALMLEPYSDDPGNRGLQIAPQEFYDDICSKALQYGYQVSTHAIGDSANRLVLNTYGRFLGGKNDRRWRIEHAQVVYPSDFLLFARYSVVPSIQATHATSDMEWAGERLGEERLRGAYAYRQLLQQLGWIPNGTDFPIEAIFPLNTFYAAVFRTDHTGCPTGVFQIENSLSREEALRSMTLWAAKASFEENEKGSLEPGKWADFVVLDTDLMTASPEEILNATVVATYIAGEKVYPQDATFYP